MPGFSAGQEDFDRIYITEEEFLNQKFGSTLYSWGSNEVGQLGQNIATTTNRSSPNLISGGGNTWQSISAHYLQAAGIKTDGTLWTWGSNGYGELGSSEAIGASRSSPQTTAAGGNNWKTVSVNLQNVSAIKTDGTLWTWGRNDLGQLGTNSIIDRSSPQTTIAGGNDWRDVSGTGGILAIKIDGTLWSWGQNSVGELGTNNVVSRSSPQTTAAGGNNWKQISAGQNFVSAIKTDGTLWTWGWNVAGQLGANNIIDRSSPQTTIAGGNDWRFVSSDKAVNSMAALKTNGTLWTWGGNFFGTLGTNSTVSRSSPQTTVAGGTAWRKIVVNSGSTFAIDSQNTLYSWGLNLSGQLGTNNTANRSSPNTIISGNLKWRFIAMGGLGNGVSAGDPVFGITEDSFSE